MKRFVYADNSATTQVSPEVLEAMMPYFKEKYGNPSSIYTIGREAAAELLGYREKIAGLLGAKANEIYFTGSGSEADNFAIKGAARANAKRASIL